MPTPRSYTGLTKLVIAFDIGATLSSISYCLLEQDQAPKVAAVTRFIGQVGDLDREKAPSLLYYDESGNVKAAGYEVLTVRTETALTERWTEADRRKDYLRPKPLASSVSQDENLPALPLLKSAADVLADFIVYLSQCAETYIYHRHPTLTRSTHSIEYIFTYPSGWEGIQQQLYHQAIVLAGLVPDTPEGHSRVHMLTEGEASLHYCIANLLDAPPANQTHGVAIIDGGDATIDLGMFLTKFNPISCDEIVPAESRPQGSFFIARRAKALFQTPAEIDDVTREFDQTTKLVIKSDREPAYVRVAGRRYHNTRYNISFGKLKLTGKEATNLFNESVDAVVDTFEQQWKAATVPIKTVFFVGDLATSGWLWSQLQSYFKDRNIDFLRPNSEANKTVVNGAVLSHIDRGNHLVSRGVARVIYGVLCSVPVKESDPDHIRRKHLWEKDPTGKHYVPGYFKATLEKGAPAREETQFRFLFSLTGSDRASFRTQTIRLVYYRGVLPNVRWVDQDLSSFSALCTIRADLRVAESGLVEKENSGRVYYDLDYDIIVYLEFTKIRAELVWKTGDNVERRYEALVAYEY